MATENFNNWVVDGVPFNITATTGSVTRTSATQFKVVINASWTCTGTVWGVQVTSGGGTADIPKFDGKVRKNGSGSLTGTFNTSTNVAATKNIEVTFKIYDDRNHSATKTLTLPSVSVPAWTSYTIKYDANGGNGAPGNQTKWHGQNLIVSSVVPTKAGHTFRGWALSKADADAGRWYYQPGSTCGQNNDLTLYAVWEAHTYQVTYDANGGTLAGESSQPKTYGQALTLTGTATRENYNFLGWGTSASATTVTYAVGSSYTANAGTTLYAVWELAYSKPRITNLSVRRCDNSRNIIDDGTYALVEFDWACDREISTIEVVVYDSTHNEAIRYDLRDEGIEVTGTSGNVSSCCVGYVIGEEVGILSTDASWIIEVIVKDNLDSFSKTVTLNGLVFPIDFLAGGKGVAFGKPAEKENTLESAFSILASGGFEYPVLSYGTDVNELFVPNTYIGLNRKTNDYTCGDLTDPNDEDAMEFPIETGTFILDVKSAGDNGQVWQCLKLCDRTISVTYERFYYGSKWGEWVRTSDFGGKLLWEGVYYMSAAQTATLSENISDQKTGIVLVFSRYSSGQAQNYHFNHAFVHKAFVKLHPGVGNTFMMTTDGSFSVMATKYLYIHDDRIVGNDINEAAGTGDCGVTYKNNGFVLRYVIGI